MRQGQATKNSVSHWGVSKRGVVGTIRIDGRIEGDMTQRSENSRVEFFLSRTCSYTHTTIGPPNASSYLRLFPSLPVNGMTCSESQLTTQRSTSHLLAPNALSSSAVSVLLRVVRTAKNTTFDRR
jgi:hypothetical protein